MKDLSGTQPMAKLVSIAEFAHEIGMSQMTIYRLIAAGELPAVRIGRRLFVPGRVLDELSTAALATGGTISAADWREAKP